MTGSLSTPGPLDPGATLIRLRAAFAGTRVSVAPGRRGLAIEYQNLVTDRFTIHRLRCVGRLKAIGTLPEAVTIGWRVAGAVALQRQGRRVDTSGVYLRPTAAAEFEVRDAAVMLVALQPAAVAEYMDRSGERSAAVNRLSTAPHLVAMGLAMQYAGGFLDDADALAPSVVEKLHDLLCWSLVRAFEDPWAETPRGQGRPSALRRALQHIEEHADGAITMPEVAAAARISVRSLSLLFRQELDTTPLCWVRDLRLNRARLDLLSGRGTVAEIAARHGLPSGGRFAAQYADKFGEPPSAALRGTARHRTGSERDGTAN